ncbi:hypothetical protein JQ561_05245 [Bradyrhizobium diazoefficiens]|nr:hypothetical protein [Bradyrhizobium diazoefficiens]MBR0926004.1 hypothetical protein [Bradyrhizobium diazoefficiens]
MGALHLPALFRAFAALAASGRRSSDVVAVEARTSDIMMAPIVPIASAAVLNLKFPSMEILKSEVLASASGWMKEFMTMSSK